ncbi:uncharacterized protein [Coffea arabica]|uniref:RNase H type-1 domain-containing protein n=1 Tax=Coffea arabica TaxID=13443 RepID=A0A6P6UAM5_COFAR|nr:uncharacterized protein LOC113708986 [Coffea arabica]
MAWRLAPVSWEGIAELQCNMWRWWDAVMESAKGAQGMDRIKLTVYILWQLWKARNKRVFQLESVDAKVIIDKAQQEWIEFEEATGPQPRGFESTEQERLSHHNWEPPMEGVVRINTDAAISAKMVRTGLGIVARNWRGDLVKVRGISRRKKGEAATEESLAIRSALDMAQAAGWTKIEVQSDCRNIVSSINAGNVQDCKLQTILEDIEALKTSFDSCIFSFVPRCENPRICIFP